MAAALVRTTMQPCRRGWGGKGRRYGVDLDRGGMRESDRREDGGVTVGPSGQKHKRRDKTNRAG